MSCKTEEVLFISLYTTLSNVSGVCVTQWLLSFCLLAKHKPTNQPKKKKGNLIYRVNIPMEKRGKQTENLTVTATSGCLYTYNNPRISMVKYLQLYKINYCINTWICSFYIPLPKISLIFLKITLPILATFSQVKCFDLIFKMKNTTYRSLHDIKANKPAFTRHVKNPPRKGAIKN